MNKIFLIGNLTRDVDLTTTGTGISVCKMSIAVNRNFTNAAGEREADFFNIVAWRQLADSCGKFLSKGKKIAVVGSLQTRSYEKDGEKKYVTEVMAEEVEFLSPRDESPAAPSAPPARNAPQQLKAIDDDGLPF